ncbi:MAG: patatin family protein [Lachnospiraceae bacterium]|nr:patatin family protein [Lachnospiraceae bacterium]
MKTGMVMVGGAMRGIYTAGALDVFMEQGIRTDGVIGVSAGALHGCSYVSGQHGRSIRYYMKYMRDPRFMSFRSFLKTGNLVDTEFGYHEIPEKLDIFDWEAFLASSTAFYVTCSNVETGAAEYILLDRQEDAIDYMRASASMPLVSQIVEVGGYKLLDGGVSDSVPVVAFRSMGYERCVVVLTRQAGYRKKPSGAGIGRVLYRKYPAFVHAMEQRYRKYNETMDRIEQLEETGEIFVLRPSHDPGIGRMERRPDKVQGVYQLGYGDALQNMEQIRTFLGIS